MSQLTSQIKSYPRGAALLALTLSVVLPPLCARADSRVTLPSGAGASTGRGERRVKLDFVSADVNVVTKALSIQSGANVVLMPTVKGTVTVRLTDLTLEDALKK